jgi:hypothetical protein
MPGANSFKEFDLPRVWLNPQHVPHKPGRIVAVLLQKHQKKVRLLLAALRH